MGRDKYEIKTLKNLYNISSHMLTYQNIILSLIFSKSYFKYLKIWGLFFLKMNICWDQWLVAWLVCFK